MSPGRARTSARERFDRRRETSPPFPPGPYGRGASTGEAADEAKVSFLHGSGARGVSPPRPDLLSVGIVDVSTTPDRIAAAYPHRPGARTVLEGWVRPHRIGPVDDLRR